jgi:hypothetical protein
MKVQGKTLLVMLLFCFLMILLVSCAKMNSGLIRGQLEIKKSGLENLGEYESIAWPGDTTSIAICLLNEDGEHQCNYQKPEFEGSEKDSIATLNFLFENLSLERYYLGFYYQHANSGANVEKELITYYHPDLKPEDRLTDISKSERISLSSESYIIDLGIIRLYFVYLIPNSQPD